MRFILKLIAAPFALLLMLVTALCSFVLFLSGKVLGVASGIAVLLAAALLIMGQTVGGIAWAVVAFIISPFGLPVVAEWLVGILDSAGSGLKAFIFS